MKQHHLNLILATIFLGITSACGGDDETNIQNQELYEALSGSWIAITENPRGWYESQPYNYIFQKTTLEASEFSIHIRDSLFTEDIYQSGDTIPIGYRYSVRIPIKTYDLPDTSIFCGQQFLVDKRIGKLDLDYINAIWEYAEFYTDAGWEFDESLLFDSIGPNVIANEAGDSIALANCFYGNFKFARVQ